MRYTDKNGYFRDGFGKLIHRKIAFHSWKKNRGSYSRNFGSYQVHHKDRDKKNNNPNNLQIVSRSVHEAIHGISDDIDMRVWVAWMMLASFIFATLIVWLTLP